ncbi:MAG: polysaccharide lyase family 7 protein [Geminicoccaceae bacterium]
MPFISNKFDLDYWKITYPVDLDSDGLADVYQRDLSLVHPGYEDYLSFDADGNMVLMAPVSDATTPNSDFARTELREVQFKDADHDLGERTQYEWNPAIGGSMSATLYVDELPTHTAGSNPASIVIGQIHSTQNEELVRLYYNENGELYYHNDFTGEDATERVFYLTHDGERTHIAPGETFSYRISAKDNELTVQARADDKVYQATFAEDDPMVPASLIHPDWQSHPLYFKAGVYLRVEAGEGEGQAKVVFKGLDIGHDGPDPNPDNARGDGLDFWNIGDLPEPPDPPPVMLGDDDDNILAGGIEAEWILGGDGNDILSGGDGDDILSGGGGDDRLFGDGGNDRLDGGSGQDVLSGGAGADIFGFSSRADSFADIDDGLLAQDLITDFTPGEDVIDLGGLGYRALGDGFGGTLDIEYDPVAGRTHIVDREVDANGQHFEILLDGDYGGTLDASDFIFYNLVVGGDGDDVLVGTDGNDIIDGLGGQDRLSGGNGADIFRFSDLAHSLDGNAENDNRYDRIADFDVLEDRIDLRGLGFTGLDTDGGPTEEGELRIAYSENTDRSYIRSDQSTFEFYLDGDYRDSLTDAHFLFDPPVS